MGDLETLKRQVDNTEKSFSENEALVKSQHLPIIGRYETYRCKNYEWCA